MALHVYYAMGDFSCTVCNKVQQRGLRYQANKCGQKTLLIKPLLPRERPFANKAKTKTSLIKNVFDFDEKRGCMLCRYQGQAGGCPPSLLQNVPNGFPPTFSLALRLIS